MESNEFNTSWVRLISRLTSLVALVLMVFVTSMMVTLKADVGHLREELATKSDLVNLAVNMGPTDPAMKTLENTCTECHTKETFASAHGMTEDVHDLVSRMSQLAGSHLTADEIPKAEAALTFMKCAHCHSQDRLKELAILSPKERWDIIIKMMKQPGAEITQQDAQRIRDFYGDFWGWHVPPQ